MVIAAAGCVPQSQHATDSDGAALRRIHEAILRSHREHDIDAWMGLESDSYVAWIELYRKQGGEWVLIGNLSNFKPESESE